MKSLKLAITDFDKSSKMSQIDHVLAYNVFSQ
jgi:hypothetical protein